MITALLLTALATQLGSNSGNLPAVNQAPSDTMPTEALNVLLDYPAGYQELRRCGRPIITTVETATSANGLMQYVFNGYHLQGDIILGDFAMNVTVISSEPEIGFTQYSHDMTLKYDGLFACKLHTTKP